MHPPFAASPDLAPRKILITGATGYIGRRLTALLARQPGLSLRLLVRNRHKVRQEEQQTLEIVEGDTFQEHPLAKAVDSIDTAYYLIHSMGAGQDFEQLDRQSAENFRKACIAAGVRRIIYLGGLGVKKSASAHLLSRIETGEILSAEPESIQTIWLRAGVIIGAGSASFEIIRNLAQKLPMMITPKWVETRTQPIGVDDVLAYLNAARMIPVTGNQIVDIGAPPMTFRQMMLEAAKVMGLKRTILPVPLLTPKLSSYWLTLFTPVPFRMAAALVAGLKSETIQQNDAAEELFPRITPQSYTTAVRQALIEIEEDQVLSRWCDSSANATCDIKGLDDPSDAVLRDRRSMDITGIPPQRVFAAAASLGGEGGWLSYHFLWQIRGFIDKLAGGYGLQRGRRSAGNLRVGDALDFWKVADIKENKRLLLLAQMKLPGKAWLEFAIQDETLIQTAHFLPQGLLGRLYWYAVSPLHHFVFRGMIRAILKRARRS